jgi:hypothetical protein
MLKSNFDFTLSFFILPEVKRVSETLLLLEARLLAAVGLLFLQRVSRWAEGHT